ncbi:MAG TPA: carbon-nitrogen hydrolase family protein [Solirubrobacterales bacterium]|nr:carbon-nitrogen hydrolase family protein [Solirubrobacterales bacterium]
MKLSLIQMNSAGERDANLARACDLIDAAASAEQPDLIVLPEFFNTIYFAQYRDTAYIDMAEPDDGPTIKAMQERARAHRCHIVATIFETESAGLYYDTAILIDPDGEIVGKYRKVQPAAVQSLEKIFFRYGSYFPVFRVGDWRVGINICYDTFFPESARCTALNGADLIVVPFAAPKQVLWRDIMRTRAFDNGVWFAPCNKVGTEREWTFPGGSMIVDPRGEVIAEAGDTEETISADLDLDAVTATRRRYPMFRDRRPELYGPICAPTEDIPRIP